MSCVRRITTHCRQSSCTINQVPSIWIRLSSLVAVYVRLSNVAAGMHAGLSNLAVVHVGISNLADIVTNVELSRAVTRLNSKAGCHSCVTTVATRRRYERLAAGTMQSVVKGDPMSGW